jgi:uncharacterized membrane protein YczE
MKSKTTVIRVLVMVLGLFIMGAGVSLAKIANRGTSPISCLPALSTYVAADLGFGMLTLGIATFIYNLIFLSIQIVLLRREFSPVQLLQVVALFIMSAAIDFWMNVFSGIDASPVWVQVVLIALSILFLALGVHLGVFANVLMVPGDAFIATLSYKLRKPYSKVKIGFDCTITALGFILSMLYFGGLYGVGVATIVSALLVGVVVKFWSVVLEPVEKKLPGVEESLVPPIVPHVY